MKIGISHGIEIRFNEKKMPSWTKVIVSRRNGSKPASYWSFGGYWQFLDWLLEMFLERLKL